MSASSDSFDRSSPQTAEGTVERDASREPRPCRRPDLQAVRVAADRSWAEEGADISPGEHRGSRLTAAGHPLRVLADPGPQLVLGLNSVTSTSLRFARSTSMIDDLICSIAYVSKVSPLPRWKVSRAEDSPAYPDMARRPCSIPNDHF